MSLSGRQISLILVALLLAGGGMLFLNRAMENGRRANTKISRTDQGAYIKYAIALRESDFSYVGRRNRMPFYPGFLAAFMEKGETPDGFFEKGKQINAWLTLGGLSFLAVVFLRCFPRHYALNLLFMTAFTVMVFRAAYVQAEVLYYLLTFAVFLLCWRLFEKPSVVLAVLAGGLLGLAHLTKASVLPGLLAFAVFYILDGAWQLLCGRQRDRPRPVRRFLCVLLVIASFLAAVFPYISKSKERYGHYFYNVNSTFYFWCDSWEDAESRTKAAGDREGWPDMPEDEIPSLKNYLRSHSAGDIAWRVVEGFSRVFNSMAKSYGYLWFCLAYLGFAGWIAWRKRKLLWKLIVKRPGPALALTAYFSGYGLLFAWYSQIIEGNRFVLGIFLPFVFTVSVFITRFSRHLRVPLGGVSAEALPLFNKAISLWLAIQILISCFLQIPTTYGGN